MLNRELTIIVKKNYREIITINTKPDKKVNNLKLKNTPPIKIDNIKVNRNPLPQIVTKPQNIPKSPKKENNEKGKY